MDGPDNAWRNTKQKAIRMFKTGARTTEMVVISQLLFSSIVAENAAAAGTNSPNVLFIAIDDWRNDLRALGVDHVHTPQMDRFAQESVLFSRHYVQVPTCGASRACLLTGLRASRTGLSNHTISRTEESWGDRVLPRVFRQHGYQTLALGKITHHPGGLTGAN